MAALERTDLALVGPLACLLIIAGAAELVQRPRRDTPRNGPNDGTDDSAPLRKLVEVHGLNLGTAERGRHGRPATSPPWADAVTVRS